MKNGEKTWEVEIGEWEYEKQKAELEWNPNTHIWKLTISRNSKVICISTIMWHYMTQIVFTDAEQRQEVFFEIFEKEFNEEFYYPKELDEIAKKITEICKIVWKYIGKDSTSSPEESCAEELLLNHFSDNATFHVYYGNGLFFGMRRKRFNKEEVEKIEAIPMRCRESPLKFPW